MRFLKRSGILEKDAPKEKSTSPSEANPKEDSIVATQAARMSPATTDQAPADYSVPRDALPARPDLSTRHDAS